MFGAGFDDLLLVGSGLKRRITDCTVTGPHQDSSTDAPGFGVGADGNKAIGITPPSQGLVDGITDLVFHAHIPKGQLAVLTLAQRRQKDLALIR